MFANLILILVFLWATTVVSIPEPTAKPDPKFTFTEASPEQTRAFYSVYTTWQINAYDKPSVTSLFSRLEEAAETIPASIRSFYTTNSNYNPDESFDLLALATDPSPVSFFPWASRLPNSIESAARSFGKYVGHAQQSIAREVLSEIPWSSPAPSMSPSPSYSPVSSPPPVSSAEQNGLPPGISAPVLPSGGSGQQGATPNDGGGAEGGGAGGPQRSTSTSGNAGPIKSAHTGIVAAGLGVGAVGALAAIL